MKQGCLLVDPLLIAIPEVFETLLDNFTLIRQLEVDETTHILIVEHESFIEAQPGQILPFYDPVFGRIEGSIFLKEISAPYIHSKYFIQCQNKQEPPRNPEAESPEPLIWAP